jgi:crotonobetainyl-CoA:carnitine CoA-transferase CaiB-like acyl-CoA transferase
VFHFAHACRWLTIIWKQVIFRETIMSQPLDGIRVLDLTRLLPGGVCSMMLVDLGADVIKIEDPLLGDYARWMGQSIDGQGVFFRMNNRGKRSLVLDLKESAGVAVFKQMAQSADVVIEGFRPGVMTRLGIGYDVLQALNPDLIYCSLSGWGMDGPYAPSAGHDVNYVSHAGLLGAMESPQVLGGQIADIGGAYSAVAGILAALLRRERTGEGAFVDTSMAESALPFGLFAWAEALTAQTGGGQGMLTGGLACYHVYRAKDGVSLALGALEEKFWANFCRAVDRPDWIADHQRPDRQAALIQEVQALFATQSAAEWHTRLEPADCCFSVVNAPGDAANDPHFKARQMLGQFPDNTPWMRSPIRISGAEAVPENQIPGYGQHSRQILTEFGFSQDSIDRLIHDEIIR